MEGHFQQAERNFYFWQFDCLDSFPNQIRDISTVSMASTVCMFLCVELHLEVYQE